ncbi:MAG TPA: cytochrome b/b6 domain-containing protein [Alphaproteobacteria bacterium]|nr:cytochrome b/b6 domain-containing protein [Alphaproteobacteria bacterium]
MPDPKPADVKTVEVWDSVVRILHWSLVVGVILAFLTAETLPETHETVGYAIGGIVVVRVIWGFVGSRHARFSDFAYGPSAVASYLQNLLGFKGRRYLGHSPAGGAMVIGLLAVLAVIVATGVATDIQRDQTPPAAAAGAVQAPAKAGGDGEETESMLSEIHEGAANLLIVLVALHVGGVLLASLVHRENLVAAMFSGRKRTDRKAPD